MTSSAVFGYAASFLSAAFVVGCGGEMPELEKSTSALSYSQIYTSTDWSGNVVMSVFKCGWVNSTTPLSPVSAQCQVDTGYVLVGGGAQVAGPWDENPSLNPGALLTESESGDDFKTWYAEARESQYQNPNGFRVRAYAIGMKLMRANGTYLTESEMKSQMWVDHSPYAKDRVGHPTRLYHMNESNQYVSGDVLLGGGAHTVPYGDGNFLVYSLPWDGGWYAESKDHLVSDPAFISVKVIAIRQCPATWGYCLKSAVFNSDLIWVDSGTRWTTRNIAASSWATSSIGAFNAYNGAGRMITNLIPSMSDGGGSTVWTKDHGVASTGRQGAFLIAVARQ
ncbi:MAG TPA: hypothetical protein VFH73_17035 [Polyangia bacterium]|jgi:hypothetical protein|nr:hypothetical protein [Polyangia bacterium]